MLLIQTSDPSTPAPPVILSFLLPSSPEPQSPPVIPRATPTLILGPSTSRLWRTELQSKPAFTLSKIELLILFFISRSFTQHWIVVGRHLRVLLLDFDGKFTLLIPNIEMGKAFRINKAEVEVQTRDLEGGHKLTFMKFIFQSPQLEIKAPVLNDKAVGYQVLSQNGRKVNKKSC